MNLVTIIIILAILLFIVFMLNHVSISVSKPNGSSSSNNISSQFGYVQTSTNCSNVPGCCSLTKYGCCPDGVNSRADFQGSNCPVSYNPGSNPNIPPPINQNTPSPPYPPPSPLYPPHVPPPPPSNIIKPLRL